MAKDTVFLRDLRIPTVIGIYDWERQIRQDLFIDLEMAWDISKAAEHDDITHTLNYKAVSKRIIDFVSTSEFQLVETLQSASLRWCVKNLVCPGCDCD